LEVLLQAQKVAVIIQVIWYGVHWTSLCIKSSYGCCILSFEGLLLGSKKWQR